MDAQAAVEHVSSRAGVDPDRLIYFGESLGTGVAVAAARESFEAGVWRNMTPDERGRILWKISDLIEANIDELAELETLDQGKPLFVGRWAEIPGAALAHGV